MKNLTIAILLILLIGGAGYFFINKKSANDTSTNKPGSVPTNTQAILDLSGQELTKAPAYIFVRTETKELNLSNNALNGSLQAEIRYLQNLKILNLSHNKFTGVPAEIGQLKNLEVLNLSDNKLTGLPNELGNLSKLKLLDISGNNYSRSDLDYIRNKLPSTTVIKTN